MKTEKIISLIMTELERAELLHPSWPKDIVKAAMIPAEETGELIKAVNDYDEKKGSKEQIITEAVHAAASAIRFLKNIEGPDE